MQASSRIRRRQHLQCGCGGPLRHSRQLVHVPNGLGPPLRRLAPLGSSPCVRTTTTCVQKPLFLYPFSVMEFMDWGIPVLVVMLAYYVALPMEKRVCPCIAVLAACRYKPAGRGVPSADKSVCVFSGPTGDPKAVAAEMPVELV